MVIFGEYNSERRDFLKLAGVGGVGVAVGGLAALRVEKELDPKGGLTIPDVLHVFGGEIAFDFMRTRVRQAPFSQYIEVRSPYIDVSHDAGGWVITDPASTQNFDAVYFDQKGNIDTVRSVCKPIVDTKRTKDRILTGILAGNAIPTAYRTKISPGAIGGSEIQLFGLPGKESFAFVQSTPDRVIEWKILMECKETVDYQYPHYYGLVPIEFWMRTDYGADLIQGLAYTDRSRTWKYTKESVYNNGNNVALCWTAYHHGQRIFAVRDEPNMRGNRTLIIPSTDLKIPYNSSFVYDTGMVVEAMAVEGLQHPKDYARLVIERAKLYGDMHHDGLPAHLLEKFPEFGREGEP